MPDVLATRTVDMQGAGAVHLATNVAATLRSAGFGQRRAFPFGFALACLALAIVALAWWVLG